MVTQHYERRNDGFYVMWGVDFANDRPGERKLYDGAELRLLANLDEKTQESYMDLRTRPFGTVETNEMGRCRRCNMYVPTLESNKHHLCINLVKELRQYALKVLPVNGCEHVAVTHTFVQQHHVVECQNCWETHSE